MDEPRTRNIPDGESGIFTVVKNRQSPGELSAPNVYRNSIGVRYGARTWRNVGTRVCAGISGRCVRKNHEGGHMKILLMLILWMPLMAYADLNDDMFRDIKRDQAESQYQR